MGNGVLIAGSMISVLSFPRMSTNCHLLPTRLPDFSSTPSRQSLMLFPRLVRRQPLQERGMSSSGHTPER